MDYELSTNHPGHVHCVRWKEQLDKTGGVPMWTHVYYGFFPGHEVWPLLQVSSSVLTSLCHLSSGFWHTLLTKPVLTTINFSEVGISSLKSCVKCISPYALFGNHIELRVHGTSSCYLSKNLQVLLCSLSSSGLFRFVFCLFVCLFVLFNIYLAAPGLSCGTLDLSSSLQYVGSSSLTRDRTWALCIDSMES